MRIDRRGNPASRRLPVAAEVERNVDLTGDGPTRLPESVDIGETTGKDRPAVPSDAFNKLGSGPGGFLNGLGNVFAAVGLALRDIRQGNSRTYD